MDESLTLRWGCYRDASSRATRRSSRIDHASYLAVAAVADLRRHALPLQVVQNPDISSTAPEHQALHFGGVARSEFASHAARRAPPATMLKSRAASILPDMTHLSSA